jgi:hypothetical protein
MALTVGQISALTKQYILPKMADAIFVGTPELKRLKEKCLKMVDGGTDLRFPVEYDDGVGGWYSGAQTLQTNVNEFATSAVFDWKQIYEPITISGLDKLKNAGDNQVIDFVKARAKNAEKAIRNNVSIGVWNAGTDSNALVGLRYQVDSANSPGGISQSDYSWWQSTEDSSTTTFSLSSLQTNFHAASEGTEAPTVLYGTKAIYNRFWSALQPQQRFLDEESGKAGFTSLVFNGVPFLVPSNMPANHLFGINENYLYWCVHKDKNFVMDDFERPRNQDVESAMIFLACALASSNNRYHFKMSALSA